MGDMNKTMFTKNGSKEALSPVALCLVYQFVYLPKCQIGSSKALQLSELRGGADLLVNARQKYATAVEARSCCDW